jgi:hypothetical protein
VAFKYYKYLEEFKKQANEHNKPIIKTYKRVR